MNAQTRFAPEIPILDLDPFNEEVLRAPEAYYEALRAAGPIVHLSRYGVLACGRYPETQEIFSDWNRFVSSRGVGVSDFKLEKPWRPPSIILEVDPPDHTRTRTVMTKAMSPKAISALKEGFRIEAERLVERLLDIREFDAVAELSEKFPLSVFPKAVGLSDPDRDMLLGYGSLVFNALGPENDLRRNAFKNAAEINAWIAAHCERDALAPGGFGDTIYQAADNGDLTEQEAGMLVRSLLSAGVDTTVAGIGAAVFCFATNPDQYTDLVENPALARQAFEEVLRYVSPVHAFFRTANSDTEVSGIAIPDGAKIHCCLGAANLDPEKWPEPGKFDIRRRPVGHLAFGTGVHGCVGQTVARQEAEAVLSALAARVGAIELAGQPVWRPNNALRSLDSLPVRLSPR